jgi:hypothetical protein
MALTGQLSDLSLAELIEFFCNQRKTGCLKITYPHGPGYFYLQAGSVVHARIGSLRGIDAVYFALTLPNASFTFNPLVEAPERTINQPWTQVVLEGLRRMDEGVMPGEAFPPDYIADSDDEESMKKDTGEDKVHTSHMPAFLSGLSVDRGSRRNKIASAGVVAVIVLVVAGVGVPAGWYSKNKPLRPANQPQTVAEVPQPQSVADAPSATPATAEPETRDTENQMDPAQSAARREREARDRERAKAREGKIDSVDSGLKPSAPASAKRVTVQVTYDENGRVTQASGGDATALRIARQKRFPPGKAGSATVTIPIN